MKKPLAFIPLIIFISFSLSSAGPPGGKPWKQGTAAELTAGTQTKGRAWSAKTLADEYSGAAAEVVDATVGAAGDTDTNHAYSKDDIHDYVAQHDSDYDGLPDGLEASSVTDAMLNLSTPNLATPSAVVLTNATSVPVAQATGSLPLANLATTGSWTPTATIDLSGATVTFGLATSDLPTTGNWTPSSGTWDLSALTLTLPPLGNGATSSGFVRLKEDTDNGTDYTDIIGAAAMTGNRTITLPDATGTVALTIDFDTWAELPAVTSANILVGNGSNQAAVVAMSGDVAIDNTGATTIQANAVDSSMINTIVDSAFWDSGGMVSDGTQCADPTKVTINSGPAQYTIICLDSDTSTIYGHIVMPDSWDGGTVTFELEYLQTAADTAVLNGDVTAQCRGATEVPSSTWGTEVAMDNGALTGSNAVDHTTSGAVTPAGTCAGGDSLWWRWQMDATGTTTAVATLHFLGMKMEYVSNVGD